MSVPSSNKFIVDVLGGANSSADNPALVSVEEATLAVEQAATTAASAPTLPTIDMKQIVDEYLSVIRAGRPGESLRMQLNLHLTNPVNGFSDTQRTHIEMQFHQGVVEKLNELERPTESNPGQRLSPHLSYEKSFSENRIRQLSSAPAGDLAAATEEPNNFGAVSGPDAW
jgi:hypothetical protein